MADGLVLANRIAATGLGCVMLLVVAGCGNDPSGLVKADRAAIEKTITDSINALQDMDLVAFDDLQCKEKRIATSGGEVAREQALLSHIRLREIRTVRKIVHDEAAADIVVYYDQDKDGLDQVVGVVLKKRDGVWLLC